MLLRDYLDQGFTKTELARKLGVSRATVYHWIRTHQLDRDLDDEPVRYTPRPPVECKIDPYRDWIQTRLDEFPQLSAVRLFEEIRRAGYSGGYTQVKDFVRSVRPRPGVEPVRRFETPPGHQAQVDFACFRLPWGRRWALLVVLAYSRLLWLRFVERQTMAALFAGLEEAFRFFEGVPHEILFDQMRAVVVDDQRLDGGPLVTNAEFARFAHHWQFRTRACRPYRAQTKGKVERPIRYLRESFFYGRTFANDDDLNERAARWLETTANVRCHATTQQRPIDRFEQKERAALQPLARRPYPRLGRRDEDSRSTTTPAPVPSVDVERRSLRDYDRVVGAGR
ncbi:MAG: IS21 family transposase [Acidobacteriota bacterium]